MLRLGGERFKKEIMRECMKGKRINSTSIQKKKKTNKITKYTSIGEMIKENRKVYEHKDVLRACEQFYDQTTFRWTWDELDLHSSALAVGLNQ